MTGDITAQKAALFARINKAEQRPRTCDIVKELCDICGFADPKQNIKEAINELPPEILSNFHRDIINLANSNNDPSAEMQIGYYLAGSAKIPFDLLDLFATHVFELDIDQTIDLLSAPQQYSTPFRKTLYRYADITETEEGAIYTHTDNGILDTDFYKLMTAQYMATHGFTNEDDAIIDLAEKTELTPWMIQGFQPFPQNYSPDIAAKMIAGRVFGHDQLEQRQDLYEQGKADFSSTKGLDIVSGIEKGAYTSWGQIVRTLREVNRFDRTQLSKKMSTMAASDTTNKLKASIKKYYNGSDVPSALQGMLNIDNIPSVIIETVEQQTEEPPLLALLNRIVDAQPEYDTKNLAKWEKDKAVPENPDQALELLTEIFGIGTEIHPRAHQAFADSLDDSCAKHESKNPNYNGKRVKTVAVTKNIIPDRPYL